ncbi:MAG: pseudouridine synthase [Planctomycetota bacterium]
MSGLIEPNPRVTFRVSLEDEDVLVVEKPAGVVTTPGVAHESDSLLNGLFASHGHRLRQLGADRDYGMLQRLDRDASGLLLIACTIPAWERLREQFAERIVKKFYWAVTRRAPAQARGVIRKPLEEHMANRTDVWIDDPSRRRFNKVKLARISPRGKPAITAFRTLAVSEAGALLECRTLTGRLHQVRAHLDSIGCAILGDRYYGPVASRKATNRLALHAHRLGFLHPRTGEPVDCRARCPRDVRRLIRQLRLEDPGVFSATPPLREGGRDASPDATPEAPIDAGSGEHA